MELKKLILPVGIIAGAGILFLYLKNKKKNAVAVGNRVGTPIPADDPTKQPIYDEILKTLASQYLQSPAINGSQMQGSTSGTRITENVMDDNQKTWWANQKAIEHFNCMMEDLRKMSKDDLNKVLDFLKNGAPTDVLKMNDMRNVAEKYPKAFDDHPCNNICTRPDGSKYSSNLPCDNKNSFNGLKGL